MTNEINREDVERLAERLLQRIDNPIICAEFMTSASSALTAILAENERLRAEQRAVVKPLEWGGRKGFYLAGTKKEAMDVLFADYNRRTRHASEVYDEGWNAAVEACAARYMNGAGPDTWDLFGPAFEGILALRTDAKKEDG